ncbi:hypothetical protein SE17_20195 [Kouleothrix aurantiaca]|uniref:Uncharacterized protein n=1 Tax=Kouleothrix aurantiaca TaxID=186479 RepID=A0A0N8PS34_9CHLR|nr:hypothetical protein SE17_20195 [Kouleothrix aurantiaca]
MIHAEIPQRRPWGAIGLLAALALGTLLAVFNLYAGLALIAVAVLTVLAMALPLGGQARRAQVSWRASVRRSLVAAGQEPQMAFVIPAESVPGYTPMLTREGVVLVNDEGTIIYRMK